MSRDKITDSRHEKIATRNRTVKRRIVISATEPSADLLAAQLINSIKNIEPESQFEGIAGPHMIAAGCKPLFHIDELSVMLFSEVLTALPRILSIRKRFFQHIKNNPPDLFIGMDAAAFHLRFEKKLRKLNIPTVHYNSPKLWAWRPGRIKMIAKATSLMLTLFPFENAIYDAHGLKAKYIGHPLADVIPMTPDKIVAREVFQLPQNKNVIAILPGSRKQELVYLGALFLKTAQWCYRQRPDLEFVCPMANQKRYAEFVTMYQEIAPELPLKIKIGETHAAIAASDAVLVASGTATLETMLLKRPMIVAYRLGVLSYYFIKSMVKCNYIALPNLLANRALVPEFIQSEATVEAMGKALLSQLQDSPEMHAKIKTFYDIHEQLKQNASQRAAEAILGILS